LLPTGAFDARYITVYIDGETGNPAFIAGDEFNFATLEPWGGTFLDPASYIPLPNASQGIPIAAVRLYTGSTTIGWGDIYDLRSPQQPLGTTGSFVNIYDEGVYQGTVGSIDFIGDNVEAIVSGAYAYIVHTGTAGGHETGTMVIYDEGDWLGVFEEMRFIGAGVKAYNSGSYVAVAITGSAGIIDLPATGSLTIYDESVLVGQADALNFVGDDVEAVMSGTVAHVIIAPCLANYTRSGDALPMATITGGYWQVPDGVYSTGSLAIMINGVWQIPVTDFQEQHPASGTFVIGEQGISTGSFVAAIWGAPT